MSEEQKNKPVEKFRAGSITATVWKNENKKENGETYVFHTINIERSYKDKNNEWQTTQSLRIMDIPKAVLILNKSYEYLSLSKDEDKKDE